MRLWSTTRGYDAQCIRVALDDRAHNWPPAHYTRRREARASFSTQWRATPHFRVKCPRELLADDNCIIILPVTMMPTAAWYTDGYIPHCVNEIFIKTLIIKETLRGLVTIDLLSLYYILFKIYKVFQNLLTQNIIGRKFLKN